MLLNIEQLTSLLSRRRQNTVPSWFYKPTSCKINMTLYYLAVTRGQSLTTLCCDVKCDSCWSVLVTTYRYGVWIRPFILWWCGILQLFPVIPLNAALPPTDRCSVWPNSDVIVVDHTDSHLLDSSLLHEEQKTSKSHLTFTFFLFYFSNVKPLILLCNLKNKIPVLI